jgi:D-threonate/D-erythronate kinase
MSTLKLLADDLTGALDTSAEFVGAFGPLDVVWSAASLPGGRQGFAIDSGTRELGPEQAFAIVCEVAPQLGGATIAYKKVDSLLRGPWIAELDACLQTGLWDACIVAPAFPHQGRLTRAGQQVARGPDGRWSAVGDSIVRQLRERGLEARTGNPADALEGGISVFDAEADADLARVAQTGWKFPGRLLWCGSGGLASVLTPGTDVEISGNLKTPVLGVFGSDHPATAAQLSMCKAVTIPSADIATRIERIRQMLASGAALVRLETPGPLSRTEAARQFSRDLAGLVHSIDPPRTLLIAGGETLKAQMLAIEARALQVLGRLEPGLPKSVIQGGPWSGVDVISKSGAFGPPDLWATLLGRNGLI